MSDEGATPRELIFEACRRDNTELLLEVISGIHPSSTKQSKEDAVAELLNTARDSMGNAPLHIAAGAGAYEVIDIILDQPGVETDPLARLSGDTPLHQAVHYINSITSPSTSNSSFNPSFTSSFPPSQSNNSSNGLPPPPPPPQSSSSGQSTQHYDESNNALVELLLDAGCDPRIRNKGGRKPIDCVETGNESLKGVLRRAEIMIVEGDGIVNEDEGSEGGDGPPSDDE